MRLFFIYICLVISFFYVLLKQQIIIKIIAMSIYVRRRLRIFKKRNNSKILNEFSGRQRDLSPKKYSVSL